VRCASGCKKLQLQPKPRAAEVGSKLASDLLDDLNADDIYVDNYYFETSFSVAADFATALERAQGC